MTWIVSHPISITLGLLTIGVLLLNVKFARRPDPVMFALAMLLSWAVTMAAEPFLSPPARELLNPALDVVLAIGFLWAVYTRFAWWKVGVLACLTVQGVWHIAYQALWPRPGLQYAYTASLNVAYFAALGCIAWPGGLNAARVVRDHLRSRRNLGSFRGFAP